jgi:class 3 adenylate cyclase/tetratricopeptide (TPR) repeat protein
MRCPRCQHENEVGAKFCEECAAPLTRHCAKCGQQLSATAKFCPECAHPSRFTPETATAPRFASPEAYTPKHLAERILNSRGALEGERKQVTVLFADLKSSMELLVDRDPEEARTLLDPILEHMIEAVHRYEGTVNQVMGDGIMALFGAPLAHEDHAVRACFAALRLQGSVRRYAEGVRRQEGVFLQVRVGLNSGEVVVRSIGSDLHMDYTAVGQTTHLAARLEQLAAPGSILLAANTLRLVEGYVQVKALGPTTLKGLTAPVDTYELTGTGIARSRLQAMATSGLSRFVGREAEVEQLRRVLEQARQGHGQVAGIVGEPGVGKTRVVFEFVHSHRMEGWLVLEASSVSYGKATSYLPVIELLKGYFRIGDRDTQRYIREKVTGKLLTLDRTLEPTLPALLALLDVPVEDAAWQALEPPQRRQRTLDGVKRLLLREAQLQPLLVVFEDLHWIDSETQAVLDGLVESLPTARVLLLVNYRPEYRQGWGGRTYYTQLRLDTLPAESASELLDALLGPDASLQPLKVLLATKTGGNPLFLEEGVRTLVEAKALLGERGAYRLAQPVEAVHVPATVEAILSSRIDRLPPDEKRLLQTAAVIGKDFPFTLLQAITGESEEALRHDLSQLQSAEFLYETSLYPDLEYTFKHALTHEVAYGSLLHERRRALHAKIVEAIEALYPDRLSEHMERLAHHAFRGEVWEKAARYLRQAGEKAAARLAHREAVACFEQALQALAHLPDSRDCIERAIDLRFDLRNSLFPLGEFGRVVEAIREAERLADSIGDRTRLALASVYIANVLWLTGMYDEAIAAAERVLSAAKASGDLGLRYIASFRLSQIHHSLGQYQAAVEFIRSDIATLTGELAGERFYGIGLASVQSRTWSVLSHAELGNFAEGLAEGEEGIRIAERLSNSYDLVHISFGVGLLHLRKGDLPRAAAVLERGLALCHASSIRLVLPILTAYLGYTYLLSGRIKEALPLLEQAVVEATTIKMTFIHSLRIAYLAEAHLAGGETDLAVELGQRSLALSREYRERGHEAWALRLLGEIASHPDQPDAAPAEDYYRQALAIANELGMRPLSAHCHLGLGKFYRRSGKQDAAYEHLAAAAAMYREMDMRFWLEQTEAELSGVA